MLRLYSGISMSSIKHNGPTFPKSENSIIFRAKKWKNKIINYFPKLPIPRSAQNRCQLGRECRGTLRTGNPGNSPKEGDCKKSRCVSLSKDCMHRRLRDAKMLKLTDWLTSEWESLSQVNLCSNKCNNALRAIPKTINYEIKMNTSQQWECSIAIQ